MSSTEAVQPVAASQAPGTPCVGRLAGCDHNGNPLVEWGGHPPAAARFVKGLGKIELSRQENRGREVLLLFDGGDPGKPVILALMADPVQDSILMEMVEEEPMTLREAKIDGRAVTIEAEEEIVLKCGQGSITIRKDGKIVVRGTNLLSRSSGSNRIKGARVTIN